MGNNDAKNYGECINLVLEKSEKRPPLAGVLLFPQVKIYKFSKVAIYIFLTYSTTMHLDFIHCSYSMRAYKQGRFISLPVYLSAGAVLQ